MKTSVAVCILNFNGSSDTIACCNSLLQADTKDFNLTVYIVDNGSKGNSLRKLKEYVVSQKNSSVVFKLLHLSQNKGFSGGNNYAIKHALSDNCSYILLLNNDTRVDKSLLPSMVFAIQNNKTIGIMGAKIIFEKGSEYHASWYKKEDLGKVIWYGGGIIDWNNVYLSHRGVDEVDKGQYNELESTDFVTGCCMMVRKEVFDKVGILDERYFLYLEDADFCMRAKKAGYLVYYNPHTVLWHKNAQSSGKPGSLTHQYYQTRNRLLFGYTYAPFKTKLALFRESMRFIKRGGIKRKAVLDYYFRSLGRSDI